MTRKSFLKTFAAIAAAPFVLPATLKAKRIEKRTTIEQDKLKKFYTPPSLEGLQFSGTYCVTGSYFLSGVCPSGSYLCSD